MRSSCLIILFLKEYRSSHRRCRSSHGMGSVSKGVLKNFANFTGKQLRWSLFYGLAGLQPASFLKRDSNTSAFLWSLRNFSEHLFWRTSASDCFRRCSIKKLFLKFCNIHRTKVPSDMCYMKKVFLVVAWSYNTKRYSWWLIELWKWRVFISINVSCKSSRLNGLFFP